MSRLWGRRWRRGLIRIERRRAGPAGIFPFRLGRQPVLAALFLAQPKAVRRRIIPTHVQDRMVVGLRKTGFLPVVLRIASFEFSLRFIPTPASLAVLFRISPDIHSTARIPETVLP